MGEAELKGHLLRSQRGQTAPASKTMKQQHILDKKNIRVKECGQGATEEGELLAVEGVEADRLDLLGRGDLSCFEELSLLRGEPGEHLERPISCPKIPPANRADLVTDALLALAGLDLDEAGESSASQQRST